MKVVTFEERRSLIVGIQYTVNSDDNSVAFQIATATDRSDNVPYEGDPDVFNLTNKDDIVSTFDQATTIAHGIAYETNNPIDIVLKELITYEIRFPEIMMSKRELDSLMDIINTSIIPQVARLIEGKSIESYELIDTV